MTGLFFDTFEAVKNLIGAGIAEKEAEAIVKVVNDSQGELATKTGLKELGTTTKTAFKEHTAETKTALEAHMTETKTALDAHMAETKTALDAHMAATEASLKAHMAATEAALKAHMTATQTALKEHTAANETALKDLGQELRQESTEAEHRTPLRVGVIVAVAVATMLAGTQLLITLNGLGS